ncbi:FAD:protein FMN transferase [Aureimonas altamirensis]|uniref:FAD:protein FMN transferase n=1 Tax=Aureimonas altamirensis TaxID=370622 RepID=UPI001E5482E5|nr:FAD:protein FMN transferase [Aureimonas altamirensis]UHD46468.1 FAD:protein FMN transferase [Aureimonas altamirensis]
MNRRSLLLGAGAAGLLAALPAVAAGDGSVLRGRAFGTRWRVVLARPAPDGLGREIDAILAAVDASMSPFRADSEITRFNRSRETGGQAASAPFAAVTAAALAAAHETGGAFDPTVGPAVHRFGFGPIRGTRIAAFGEIGSEEGSVSKHDAALSLDLCAIAKGYAVDRVSAHLAALGQEDFLVEIGGDLRVSGRAPADRPWQVGIEDPAQGSVRRVVALRDEALATSGDAVNGYTLRFRRYGHVIDPATGEPVQNAVASVSVIAPVAARADALATALLVMGTGRGLRFAAERGIPAFFLLRGPDGRLTERVNPLFHTRLAS